MGRRGFSVLVISVLVLFAPSVFVGDEKAEQEAVKTFKQYVSDLMGRYKAEKHERTGTSPHCEEGGSPPFPYLRAVYEPSVDYKIDVRKTDSLVTPYAGILEFRWNERFSVCHETREEAQADSKLSGSNSLKYRYTYAFQDGKWVPKDREIGSLSIDSSRWEWESCADEEAYLAPRGYEADFGCLVPY
jgi:hypothetical protein